jgi:hypothetical protein
MPRLYLETTQQSAQYAEGKHPGKKDEPELWRLEVAIAHGIVHNKARYRAWMTVHHGFDPEEYRFRQFLIDLNAGMGNETPAYHSGTRSPTEVAMNLPERLELRPGICVWLERTNDAHRRLLQAYRGRGKTHIICAYAAWLLMRDPCDTVLIIRAGFKLARNLNKQIKNLIERFPKTRHLKAKVPRTWGKTELEVARWFHRTEPSVTCTRKGSGFTGFRGRLIIADDLEARHNVHTPEQREEIRETTDQMSLVGADIIYIGTPHAVESVYDDLVQTEHYETQYYRVWLDQKLRLTQNPYVKMNRTQLQGAEWVDDQERRLPVRVFRSQLLLIPSDVRRTRLNWDLVVPFNGGIQKERSDYSGKIEYWQGEHQILELKAYWDPGYRRPDTDASVLRVVGRRDQNHVFVFECVTLPKVDTNKTFHHQCEKIVEVLAKYSMDQVIVETNFRVTLINELKRVAAEKKRALRVSEHQRRAGYGGKANFIRSQIEPVLNSRELHVHEAILRDRKLEVEAKSFPKRRRDDHLDATAGAIRFLRLKRIHVTGGKSDPNRLPGPKFNQVRLNSYKPFQKHR